MNASTLGWWLELTPWWCVAYSEGVRHQKNGDISGTVYVWANFCGQYLLERGQQLSGFWEPDPGSGTGSKNDIYRYHPKGEHPTTNERTIHELAVYVHPLTHPQAYQIIDRYNMQIVGTWAPHRRDFFLQLGLNMEVE